MITIQLTIPEFYNFKKIFKTRYFSQVYKGYIKITANANKLAEYGYIYRFRLVLKKAPNELSISVVALSRNLKLTTTFDRAITQNHCYVPLNL